MTRPIHYGVGSGGAALASSLRAMTLGTLQAYNERQAARETDGIGEIDQQFQLTIAGKAGPKAIWETTEVPFDAPFIDGSEDRNAPFLYPLFTFGSVVTQGSKLVIVCNVTAWHTDEDYVNGCTIEIGIFRPAGGGIGDFAGELHLNFQGWGAPEAPEPTEGGSGSYDPHAPMPGV
jgi:hypothetical protein